MRVRVPGRIDPDAARKLQAANGGALPECLRGARGIVVGLAIAIPLWAIGIVAWLLR